MASRAVLTYDDYAALPNDGKRDELHEGKLCPIPTPTVHHQQILGNLGHGRE